MEFAPDQLKSIFLKTNGVCRICRGTEGSLAFDRYADKGAVGGWEVQHLPDKGHKNKQNLEDYWPVHVKCNGSQGGKKNKKHRRSLQGTPLVPDQDMEMERWLANLRGSAGL